MMCQLCGANIRGLGSSETTLVSIVANPVQSPPNFPEGPGKDDKLPDNNEIIGPLVIAQLLHNEKTLLAIGNELGLSGWGLNNSGYCSWLGIACGSNNSMVEKLDLSRRGLQGNVTLISELKALKWLDLSYNNFHGSSPPAFGNLSELEFLDLSSNKFGSSIPTELGRLRNLRSLNLSNNWLTGAIPNELEGLKKFNIFKFLQID
ncbi:hypothetical protein F0562_017376 [Nyssa sinensis]|uniref:Leucine-rich repeat-containing N-terminal plant-type domain-containing protein n=1 Tax=Nyssa sinensis TaxID=561372 RepID=A0A5J4ZEM5_9ASTE|nr:hypothetical protein F0562_017376 [Nyssa sinensis]